MSFNFHFKKADILFSFRVDKIINEETEAKGG